MNRIVLLNFYAAQLTDMATLGILKTTFNSEAYHDSMATFGAGRNIGNFVKASRHHHGHSATEAVNSRNGCHDGKDSNKILILRRAELGG